MANQGSTWLASALSAECRPHSDFLRLRSETLYGREPLLRNVLSYVVSGEHQAVWTLRSTTTSGCAHALTLPLVQRTLAAFLAEPRPICMLHGDAGAGKSALIAECARRMPELLPHVKVFYHFVGSAPGSTDLVRLLRRLWLELAPALENQALPPSEEGLVRGAPDLLARAGRDCGGAVLFLDALNQLDADAEQSQLQWLPALLPPGIRCVVSVIGQTPFHGFLAGRSPPPQLVPVGALDTAASGQIVEDVLRKSGSAVPTEVAEACTRQLLLKVGARNPMWLVNACEELLAKAAFGSLSMKAALDEIQGYPDDLLELLQRKLARVESVHDKTRTIAALCLLECSRHGLSGAELRELLADEQRCRFQESVCDEVDLASTMTEHDHSAQCLKSILHTSAQVAVQQRPVQLETLDSTEAAGAFARRLAGSGGGAPPKVAKEEILLSEGQWLPIHESLRPFLRPCGNVGNEGHLDFFHRSVSKAVRLRYLSELTEPSEADMRACRRGVFVDFLQHRDATKLGFQQTSASAMELDRLDFDDDLAERCRHAYNGDAPQFDPPQPTLRRAEHRYTFWHGKLADFFERSGESQRRAEELPYHLEKVLDNSRLLRSLVQWSVFSRLSCQSGCFDLMRYCRAAGGYGAVAAALHEQLGLWKTHLSAEALARRCCVLADFMTRAGQSGHAIAVLEAIEREEQLQPATRAKRLGILAEALLCDACFTTYDRTSGGARVLLEQSVALWRSCGPADDANEGQRLDESALAQNLSNLCFQYAQDGDVHKAEDAGRESMELFSRLQHPRLAQAEQHMAHVFRQREDLMGALALYRQSVATFERTGAATFDTEYACSLSSVGLVLQEVGIRRGQTPGCSAALPFLKAAVLACEAITGRDHPEAEYFRKLLTSIYWMGGNRVLAIDVRGGAEVELTEADIEAMKLAWSEIACASSQ
eukprot:TRINITY_DN11121_c0_g3_i1.p1 TRINITY_DN11121_c0_g3~~TRINITY_DN11121_c0_g3_i1.p1  ORF type:complete len:939 (-),score=146.27 TRINITY_DN11121_c0_g3_i1:117-2933(-)